MDISVIFATFKRSEILSRTLESLCHMKTNGLQWEIIIVDNADDKQTKNTVAKFSDKLPIKYIVEIKKGKNNALNKAIKIGQGDLFVFTDDDILADSNWLMEMWEGSKRWKEYSVFGGRILPHFPDAKLPIPREHPFFNGAFVIADWGIEEGPYEAHQVWGPNMAVRSGIFHQGRKFNTDIGPNGNNYILGSETEFTLGLEKAGIFSIYLPRCLVYHQIRIEQFDVNWIYGRAFKWGRSHAMLKEKPNVKYIFRAPRHLFRKLLEITVKRIIYFYNKGKRIDLGIDYWRIRGTIYQFRHMH